MTKLIAVAFVFVMSSAAFATESYDASKTSCAQLQAALQKDGSVSIETSFGSNEYVASPTDCNAFQTASPAYEAASDTALCSVGYVCRNDSHH